MTGIWTKILNDAISKKVALVGYENLPITLRKLYSNKHQARSQYNQLEEDLLDERESEHEEDDSCDIGDDQEDEDRWHYHKSRIRHDKTIQPDKSYRKYKGAIVIDPVRGLHKPLSILDAMTQDKMMKIMLWQVVKS